MQHCGLNFLRNVYAGFKIARHKIRQTLWSFPGGPWVVFIAILYSLFFPFYVAANAQRHGTAVILNQPTLIQYHAGTNKTFSPAVSWNANDLISAVFISCTLSNLGFHTDSNLFGSDDSRIYNSDEENGRLTILKACYIYAVNMEVGFNQVYLSFNQAKSTDRCANTTSADNHQGQSKKRSESCEVERPGIVPVFFIAFSLVLGGLGGAFWVLFNINDNRCALRTTLFCVGVTCGAIAFPFYFLTALAFPYTWGLPPQWLPAKWNPCPQDDYQRVPHGETVSQKVLTRAKFSYYNNYMANVLNTDKQIAIIASLCEGSSIRSIERITGVHRDTIMRLGVKVGHGCTALMDAKMRDLSCQRLEMDEIWGFIGKKEKRVRPDDDPRMGDVWTFCVIDADTKLVPSFKVGKRDGATANAFVEDVAGRMMNRLQISTDGLKAYVDAIEGSFGADVDYAQIVKTYGNEEVDNRRYSPAKFVSSEKRVVMGFPDVDLISTSYVERLNATTRLHMRRLTRLTLAFSKKFENFEAAVGLHFAYYNFVKRHGTLRMTPAMAAGVTPSFWSVADLVEASA
jgi:IS1 family transposase